MVEVLIGFNDDLMGNGTKIYQRPETGSQEKGKETVYKTFPRERGMDFL